MMGNSVPTWNKNYYISKRNRAAATAITAHTASIPGRRPRQNREVEVEDLDEQTESEHESLDHSNDFDKDEQ